MVDGNYTGISDGSEAYQLPWNTSSLKDSTTHIIVIRAFDDNENQTDSAPITVTVDNSGAIPEKVNLSTNYESGTVNVIWSKSNDEDFESYKLYESENDDFLTSTLLYETSNIADTAYAVSGFSAGMIRYYWLSVFDSVGLERRNGPAVGTASLFTVTFAECYLAEDDTAYVLIHNDQGDLLADTFFTDNFQHQIERGYTGNPVTQKISFSYVDNWSSSNSTRYYLLTHSDIDIGTTWEWICGTLPNNDQLGTAYIVFNNFPDETYMSLLYPQGSSWDGIDTNQPLDVTIEDHDLDYLLMYRLGSENKYYWIEDLVAGETRTLDFNTLPFQEADSSVVTINGEFSSGNTSLTAYVSPNERYGYSYNFPNPRFSDDSSSVTFYYAPGFSDYRTNGSFSTPEGSWWYDYIYGVIPSELKKMDADFTVMSPQADNFQIQTSGNFDFIRTFWRYYETGNNSYYNLYISHYGMSEQFQLLDLPDWILNKYPNVSSSNDIPLYRIYMYEFPDWNGYEAYIEERFESGLLYLNTFSGYQLIIKEWNPDGKTHVESSIHSEIEKKLRLLDPHF